MEVRLFDTTLRDGTQWEGISLSVEDKLKIALKLDEFHLHYIEGGWPGSNPKDLEFFQRVKHVPIRNSTIVAFGSTRRPHGSVDEDDNIRALVEADAPAVALVAKSWDMHVAQALRTSLAENLSMIRDSVGYLKSKGREIVYDAEHFFDGFRSKPKYAMETLRTAHRAGADVLVLCDTNGGSTPWHIAEVVSRVREAGLGPLGIHVHNDTGMAVANSLVAVKEGVVHVQGTVNGYGERCGNADLCAIIPNLVLKMGIECMSPDLLARLTELSWYVSEIANVSHDEHQPYVGRSAFAHKGGIHVSAVVREASTYEHIDPELVGNQRRVVVSDLAGKSNVLYKAERFGLHLDPNSPEVRRMLNEIKELEYQGYQFEGADATLELRMKKTLGIYQRMFELEGFRITVEKRQDAEPLAEATIKVYVDGEHEHTAAEGDGPVHALDNALRKALEQFYPALRNIKLTDYKVRVLDAQDGTAAKVRVLIESADEQGSWGTVGVSTNIIEASWQALVDSIEYGLRRQGCVPEPSPALAGHR